MPDAKPGLARVLRSGLGDCPDVRRLPVIAQYLNKPPPIKMLRDIPVRTQHDAEALHGPPAHDVPVVGGERSRNPNVMRAVRVLESPAAERLVPLANHKAGVTREISNALRFAMRFDVGWSGA